MLFTHCQKRDFEAKKCSVLSKILIGFSENPLELGKIGEEFRTLIFTAFSMRRGAESLENKVFSGFSHLPLSYVRYIYFFFYHQFRWNMKLICWDWILPKIIINANYDAQLKKRWRFDSPTLLFYISFIKILSISPS